MAASLGFEYWLSPSTAGKEEETEGWPLGLLLHEEKSGDKTPVWQRTSFCQRTLKKRRNERGKVQGEVRRSVMEGEGVRIS